MTLWNPGTIEGVTFKNAKLRLGMEGVSLDTLRNLLQGIVKVYTYSVSDRAEWMSESDIEDMEKHSCNIAWDEMPIVDWQVNVSGDSDFDLLCAAANDLFSFKWEGQEWVIHNAVGGCHITAATGESRSVYRIGEKVVAETIKQAGYVNPDPYIGLIEVAYSTRGYRTGYGIRRSGRFSCWYD